MYCKKCGTQNDDNAYKCTKCGEVIQTVAPATTQQKAISNYLIPSILVTIFCCLPFGIPAIVFAAQVNGKIQAGDIQGATEASGKAKMWTWVSFGAGLLILLIYLATTIISVAGAAAGGR